MTTYGSIVNAANKPSRRNGLAVFVAGVLALGVFAVASRDFDNKLESGPVLRSAPPPPSSEQGDCDDKELAFYTLIGNGREATFKKSGVAGLRGTRTDRRRRRPGQSGDVSDVAAGARPRR